MYAMFLYMKYDDGKGRISTQVLADETEAEELQEEGERGVESSGSCKMPEEVKSDIARMMSIVPIIRHRIAGKTVHLEKFVELRSYLFFRENETMLLPILDMFYLWNIFPMMQMNPSLITPFLDDIEDNLLIYTPSCDQRHRYYYLIFFKGICLRYMDHMDSAIECFKLIIACESDIIEYTHLPPHAALELGLLYRKMDQPEEAADWLNKAIYNYTNYMNATTVHIRAHTALSIIRQSQEGARASSVDVDAQIEARLRELKEQGVNGFDDTVKAAIDIDPSQLVEVEDLWMNFVYEIFFDTKN